MLEKILLDTILINYLHYGPNLLINLEGAETINLETTMLEIASSLFINIKCVCNRDLQ